jgi:ParB family transcriptional regulator, chromosome partitioning protein
MSQTDTRGPARRRLGRGINALIGGGGGGGESEPTSEAVIESTELRHVPVALIERSPYQPRQDFGDQDLKELADSIRQHGVLQPLLVRSHDEKYQLIAGERRWLAAQKAGLETVPCRVLELEDQNVNEAAIEENLKRKDLNVLEKALAFRHYLDRFSCSIEELAKKLSMTRANVSNMLRLLELPQAVQELLRNDKLSYGHARAILPLPEDQQVVLCEQIQSGALSVRKTEAAVRAILKGEDTATVPFAAGHKANSTPEPTNHVLSLQQQLRDQLGAKVEIRLTAEDKGTIVIKFDSNEDFERILRNLRRAA